MEPLWADSLIDQLLELELERMHEGHLALCHQQSCKIRLW